MTAPIFHLDQAPAEYRDLIHVVELMREHFQSFIIYFDTSVFITACEAAVKDKRNDLIDWIVNSGNFRISRAAVNELKAWKFPPQDPKRSLVWSKAKEMLRVIERKFPQNIEEVSDREVVAELSHLDAFLSKAICFRIIMDNFDAIEMELRRGHLDLRRLADGFFHACEGRILHEYYRRLAAEGIDTDPMDDKELRKILPHILHLMLMGVLELMRRYRMPLAAKNAFENIYAQKTANDRAILAHYLTSPHPAVLATEDRDLREYLSLYRRWKRRRSA
ncbi:hypothetical protein J4419_01070 [Candidatus Woesearchaeota archaeon]|nr:hypothetical protein [Candidatus Woesearchaeota archaeon]